MTIIDAMTEWFPHPVLHVSSVETSLRFYVDQLGFTVPWRYEQEGRCPRQSVGGYNTMPNPLPAGSR